VISCGFVQSQCQQLIIAKNPPCPAWGHSTNLISNEEKYSPECRKKGRQCIFASNHNAAVHLEEPPEEEDAHQLKSRRASRIKVFLIITKTLNQTEQVLCY
jgi:hypothetical protein